MSVGNGEGNCPPHNPGYERSALSLAWNNPGLLDLCVASDYHDERHGEIHRALIALRSRGAPATLDTVATHLHDAKRLDRAGGTEYLMEVIRYLPASASPEYFAGEVREAAYRRRMLAFAERTAELARNPDADIEVDFGALCTEIMSGSASNGCGRARTVCLADVEPREVAWLWPGRIPLGRITLLVGQPGVGKSFLTCDMAARVTTQSPWPDGSHGPQGSVVLLSAEDDASDTTRPRLDAHLADVSRVHQITAVETRDGDRCVTLADVDVIEGELKRLGDVRLVVVDPIGSFLGGRVDSHRDNEVRSVLAPIAALAEKYNAAVLVIAHRRKSSGGFADDLALGSKAFTGIARAVWHLTRDTDDPARRLLLPGKCNIAPEAGGLAWTIIPDPPRIAWEADAVGMTADDALKREQAAQRPGPDAESRSAAEDWLRGKLADGRRLAKELQEEWREGEGGSKRTLDRAKQKIGVVATRPENPGPWWWSLNDQ